MAQAYGEWTTRTDVLDVGRVPADEALAQVSEGALNGLMVALKRCLAPTDNTGFCLDANEEPARANAVALVR